MQSLCVETVMCHCVCGQGNISRQEAVSMIPPLVLDVQPDSKVSSSNICLQFTLHAATTGLLVFSMLRHMVAA